MGAGAWLPAQRLSAARVVESLGALLRSNAVRARCRMLSRDLAGCDGIGVACDHIEAHAAASNADRARGADGRAVSPVGA